MITDKELQSIKLSATQLDYYQIWEQLLDLAQKISNRWDPTTTNESDPGIVLLKVLTAVGDKLCYMVDKNTLEAFLPSAAQEDSVRKLTEANGYSMQYYQSATVEVKISYTGEGDWGEGSTDEIIIPKYTTITNVDNDVSYITLSTVTLTKGFPSATVQCIEGQLVECETTTDNIISLAQLDDNNRYYLPEIQIAENGIFVYNIENDKTSTWQKTTNLNTIQSGSKYYKFGYDSKIATPYIQFPEDISSLIADGLKVSYLRTSGKNGNIAAKTLTALEVPSDTSSWGTSVDEFISGLTSDDFTITNLSASTGGADKETIDEAYNNYIKTVGLCDTLVTCRDYMNKIYQLLDTNSTVPLVSNILVSDIRDDINKSITLCSFDKYGINYTDTAIELNNKKQINNFDLILYPFKTVYGLNTISEYKNSFTYSADKINDIKENINEVKTIAHVLNLPAIDSVNPINCDIVCIKNYLKLKAIITPTAKVNAVEQTSILTAIKTAIFKQFNLRQLDFGESIPFDSILECIKTADERIKNVSLEEPALYTKFLLSNGYEYDNACAVLDLDTASTLDANITTIVNTLSTKEREVYVAIKTKEEQVAYLKEHQKLTKQIYNKLALRNIVAGRLELFDYNTEFEPSLAEAHYTAWDGKSYIEPFSTTYPDGDYTISQLKANCTINIDDIANKPITLNENEVIQFRAPNFKTTITYPAYVNYYLHLNGSVTTGAIPATFISLNKYLTNKKTLTNVNVDKMFEAATVFDSSELQFTISGTTAKVVSSGGTYKIKITTLENFSAWYTWICTQIENGITLSGLYRASDYSSVTDPIGEYIDNNHVKYIACTTYTTSGNYFVQETHSTINEDPINGYTKDGFGRNAVLTTLAQNGEYQLKDNEYLYINYTSSTTSTSEDGTSTDQVINIRYPAGTIIRPNFSLADSALTNANGASFPKTSGFDSTWGIKGMFSLGTNEQIEIRDAVEVNLHDSEATGKNTVSTYYFYWNLKNEDKNQYKDFFEDETGAALTSRTLQDGEYFYYTDANKTDMAYYGAGCEIIKIEDASEQIQLKKSSTDTQVSSEAVLSNGLSIIPWVKCTLGNGKNIIVKEYQYVNLVADNILTNLKLKNAATTLSSDTWQTVDQSEDVKYIINGEESTLPVLNLTSTSGTTGEWQVRSKLEFNVGPKVTQTLHTTENARIKDTITIVTTDNKTIELTPQKATDTTYAPLSLKANYLIQTSNDNISTKMSYIDEEGTTQYINDFKLKIFNNAGISVKDPSGVYITEPSWQSNNFGTNWTQVSFVNDAFKNNGALQLHADFNPEKGYALIMILYQKAEEVTKEIPQDNAYIRCVTTSDKVLVPKIFNYTSDWWEAYSEKDSSDSKVNYYLKSGINVIQLTEPCTISIYADSKKIDTVTFSNLDIINTTTNSKGINIDLLQYYVIDKADAATQLLADINTVDLNHIFYYNTPLESSLALNINSNLTNSDKETLATPRIWYDYNNANNKFVISEIDADFLSKGITIDRSSKL